MSMAPSYKIYSQSLSFTTSTPTTSSLTLNYIRIRSMCSIAASSLTISIFTPSRKCSSSSSNTPITRNSTQLWLASMNPLGLTTTISRRSSGSFEALTASQASKSSGPTMTMKLINAVTRLASATDMKSTTISSSPQLLLPTISSPSTASLLLSNSNPLSLHLSLNNSGSLCSIAQ